MLVMIVILLGIVALAVVFGAAAVRGWLRGGVLYVGSVVIVFIFAVQIRNLLGG